MSRFLVLIRLWPGFQAPFPFEQFNSLRDEDLDGALEDYAKIQLAANRPRIRMTWKKRSRDLLVDFGKQSKKRMGPPRACSPVPFNRRNRIRGAERNAPLIVKVGAWLGWWTGSCNMSGTWSRPYSRRYLVADAETREHADLLADKLRVFFREHPFTVDEKSEWFTQLNAWFSVVSCAELRPSEVDSLDVDAGLMDREELSTRDAGHVTPFRRESHSIVGACRSLWASEGPALAASAATAEMKRTRRANPGSTRGAGRAKLIAALTKYHRYTDGREINETPVGVNELARLAGVVGDTASRFFTWAFGSHDRYKAVCDSKRGLIFHLQKLNGELSPAREREFYLQTISAQAAKDADE